MDQGSAIKFSDQKRQATDFAMPERGIDRGNHVRVGCPRGVALQLKRKNRLQHPRLHLEKVGQTGKEQQARRSSRSIVAFLRQALLVITDDIDGRRRDGVCKAHLSHIYSASDMDCAPPGLMIIRDDLRQFADWISRVAFSLRNLYLSRQSLPRVRMHDEVPFACTADRTRCATW